MNRWKEAGSLNDPVNTSPCPPTDMFITQARHQFSFCEISRYEGIRPAAALGLSKLMNQDTLSKNTYTSVLVNIVKLKPTSVAALHNP